jgi:hypothetical protein
VADAQIEPSNFGFVSTLVLINFKIKNLNMKSSQSVCRIGIGIANELRSRKKRKEKQQFCQQMLKVPSLCCVPV